MVPPRRKLFSAFGLSVTFHACLLAVLVMLAGLGSEQVDTKVPPIRTKLVFLQQSGPGGGGGGNPTPAAPTKVEIPPPHPVAVTLVPPSVVPLDPPPPSLDAPLQTTNATVLMGGGTTLGAPPGLGGNGPGKGMGDGDGDGKDKGKGGNTGGGEKQPGGMVQPFPIRDAKPEYTGGALQAKIQGSVTLEVEVLANGTVGAVKVIKSLDRVYGLDAAAIRAARQWLFRPATVGGKPVDSIVQLILDFNLR